MRRQSQLWRTRRKPCNRCCGRHKEGVKCWAETAKCYGCQEIGHIGKSLLCKKKTGKEARKLREKMEKEEEENQESESSEESA